jgi:histidine triad (HIT) family protein
MKSTMHTHAPPDYVCPFCLLVAGVEDGRILSVQSDIVYQDEAVTAFIGTRQWHDNQGHVIVVPNQHFENIYDLPTDLAAPIQEAARSVALAMKAAYGCDGVSTRQHNEPSGNQDVWHYHLHVFPRYFGDRLHKGGGASHMEAEERAGYARRPREAMSQPPWDDASGSRPKLTRSWVSPAPSPQPTAGSHVPVSSRPGAAPARSACGRLPSPRRIHRRWSPRRRRNLFGC